MLKVVDLKKEFRTHDYNVMAVNGISFSIEQGVFTSVIGESGSGKTTLLSLLGSLDRPTSGLIEIDGEDITKLPNRQLIHYRCEKIGFVFQDYNLIPNLTALDNVMLPMEFAGISKAERKKRASILLDQVGMDKKKQLRKPRRLSGGEQQRVAIARALANKPKLILADEPTGNLDSQTSKIIVKLLHHLAKSENTTIIAVTHDTKIAKQADVKFYLKDGKIVKSE